MINNKSEYDLIYSIKNNLPDASDALNSIINQHSALFHQITNKVFNSESGVKQDFIDSKPTIFWQAITKYEPERSQLSSWIGTFSRFAAFNTLKHEGKHFAATQTDPKILEEITEKIDNSEEKRDQNNLLSWVRTMAKLSSDPRLKTIVSMRFCDEKPKSLKEIAEVFGMTSFGISLILKNFLRLVRNKMNATENYDLI